LARVRMSRSMWRRPCQPEEGECAEREVDEREQPALARALCGQRRLVVGEAGDGVNHGREVRRDSPGRPGVFRLVEEGRDQGKNAMHPTTTAPSVKRALARNGSAARQDCQSSHSPIVPTGTGPSTACRGAPPWRQPRRAGCPSGLVEGPLEGDEAAGGEEHDERVHPHFGCVVDGKGELATSTTTIQATGRPANRRAATQVIGWSPPTAPRQRAHRAVRLAEDQHPKVQQHVVQRRRAVLLQGGVQVAEWQPGDVDRQSLIEPQAERVQKRSQTPAARMSPTPIPASRRALPWSNRAAVLLLSRRVDSSSAVEEPVQASRRCSSHRGIVFDQSAPEVAIRGVPRPRPSPGAVRIWQLTQRQWGRVRGEVSGQAFRALVAIVFLCRWAPSTSSTCCPVTRRSPSWDRTTRRTTRRS